MFAFVKGVLHQVTPSYIVIDVQGVGYKIWVAANTFSHLPQAGAKVTLHTTLVVRENSHTLYGFLGAEERELFEMLIQVSGIGPKMALSIIGHLTMTDLLEAVSRSDAKAISRVPGIGKKTAERLIVEMRDKLPGIFPHTPSELAAHTLSDPKSLLARDILGALMNLGYTQARAKQAVDKTLEGSDEKSDLPTLITSALKHLN